VAEVSLALSAARLILDTGGLLAWSGGDARVRAYIRNAAQQRMPILIPAVVVAQVIRGGPRDAPINRVLNAVRLDGIAITPATIIPVDGMLAREAGKLLGLTRTTDVVDAVVVAEAARRLPATILTSDHPDMMRLVSTLPDHARIRVVRV
jgi:hypothetical protein